MTSPAEWPARRAEILKYWHGQLGPWPELLAKPRLVLGEKQDRDGVTQYRVQVEIAPGVMQHAILLLPPARFTGKRPAVLVPFYVGSWTAIQVLRWARRPAQLKAWFGGWRAGWRENPGGRRRMRWRTVWRMTLAGRPPIV